VIISCFIRNQLYPGIRDKNVKRGFSPLPKGWQSIRLSAGGGRKVKNASKSKARGGAEIALPRGEFLRWAKKI
jgi:hypothetical protein